MRYLPIYISIRFPSLTSLKHSSKSVLKYFINILTGFGSYKKDILMHFVVVDAVHFL